MRVSLKPEVRLQVFDHFNITIMAFFAFLGRTKIFCFMMVNKGLLVENRGKLTLLRSGFLQK